MVALVPKLNPFRLQSMPFLNSKDCHLVLKTMSRYLCSSPCPTLPGIRDNPLLFLPVVLSPSLTPLPVVTYSVCHYAGNITWFLPIFSMRFPTKSLFHPTIKSLRQSTYFVDPVSILQNLICLVATACRTWNAA